MRISKKHGINPSISVCFFCGEDKNEIALMGHLKGDTEAPRRTVLNYDPCEKCQKIWDEGVPILEVSATPNGENQPPLQKNAYPTGRFAVTKQEALKDPEKYPKGKPVLMTLEDFKELMDNANS